MNKSLNTIISYFMLILIPAACKMEIKKEFDKDRIKTIPETIQYDRNYDGHLQGMASDFKNHIFWSHTQQLVKTDLKGNVLKEIDVQFHHGDLEYYKGKVYVAVNFGKFNEEPGLADSWIYIYDAKDLDFIEKYPVPEVVHGAGGIAINNNQAMVVGGLPDNGKYNHNYVYEYDLQFNFKKRHELAGGFTYKGIQTACYFNGHWYFACYGNAEKKYIPKVLEVKQTTENKMELVHSINTDMSYGMIGLLKETFLTSNRTMDAKAKILKLE